MLYEDRSARISILAGRHPPRPDTLKQTDLSALSIKPLANGAGHTFFEAEQTNKRRFGVGQFETSPSR